MHTIRELQDLFKLRLSEHSFPSSPTTLYDPVRYVMGIGGKRIRPALLLASYDMYADAAGPAFEASLAVEVFHNFTLLHDDIMDEADLRRNKPTVHVAYDENKAILSGDVMMIYAYQLLEKYPEQYYALSKVFSQTAREVCEGQSMDMHFESVDEVSISEYLRMIELKTSVLLAASLKMGGILGNASIEDLNHLYEFGKNLGISFQIQDDLLDTFGTEEQLGKKIGGDITQRKKTYLYIKALELLSEQEASRLRQIYTTEGLVMDATHIAEAKSLITSSHVKVHAEELKLVYQQLALSHLDAIQVTAERKTALKELADYLLNREV